MSTRTRKVILTPESKVLKKLRTYKGLSMKQVGAKVGFSDSYISLIENGRSATPKGEALEKLLKVYGVKPKYFFQLCREWKDTYTDKDYLADALDKLPQETLKILRKIAEETLKEGA